MIPLLADTPVITPVEAEWAFAADARTIGQWTAFRKWSTDDAVVFVPQPTNAHEFLKDKSDPKAAIDWWPTASYISCDGKLAVNTGGWKRPDGSVGYFSTVWQRQPDGGWKWIVDGGDALEAPRPRPAEPLVRHASCEGKPAADLPQVKGTDRGFGVSDDRSLAWTWIIGPNGQRGFAAAIWDGKKIVSVIDDHDAVPAK